MRVLVTGATGFTGSHTVPLLIQHGYDVRCFVRPTSDRSRLPKNIDIAEGTLDDRARLEAALRGMDALVNIASLGFGHAPNIVQACHNAGIKRGIFLSSTAIFTKVNAPSKPKRKAGEDAVLTSDLDYTVLRPTMIYGTDRDRNMIRLVRYVQRFPLLPIFGSGTYLQQPIHVDDVAMAIVQCLQQPATIGKAYNIAGQKALSYNEVIDTVSRELGKSIVKLHIPTWLMLPPLKLIERIGLRLPLKAEQVERLNEDKAFDYSEAAQDFDFHPRAFGAGIAQEIASIRQPTVREAKGTL